MADTATQGQPNGHLPAPPDYTGRPYGAETALNEVAAGTPPAAPSPLDRVLQEATAAEPPHPSLFRPSDQPDHPVTTGLPMGPGAGPEVLDAPAVPRVTQMLDLLASTIHSPLLASLAAQAAALNL